MIVDDSALVRKLLSETLTSDPELEVIGYAPDPIIAMRKMEKDRPDVLFRSSKLKADNSKLPET